MARIASQVFQILTSPNLPGQILLASGSIATVIIVIGVGLWTIFGACKLVMLLIGVND
jgi:hypothetical protein